MSPGGCSACCTSLLHLLLPPRSLLPISPSSASVTFFLHSRSFLSLFPLQRAAAAHERGAAVRAVPVRPGGPAPPQQVLGGRLLHGPHHLRGVPGQHEGRLQGAPARAVRGAQVLAARARGGAHCGKSTSAAAPAAASGRQRWAAAQCGARAGAGRRCSRQNSCSRVTGRCGQRAANQLDWCQRRLCRLHGRRRSKCSDASRRQLERSYASTPRFPWHAGRQRRRCRCRCSARHAWRRPDDAWRHAPAGVGVVQWRGCGRRSQCELLLPSIRILVLSPQACRRWRWRWGGAGL